MSTASAEVIASVNVWRDSLVGLSGQSPLVKFRAPKASSLRFSLPASDKIFALLNSGEELTISGTLTSDSVGEETELRLLDVDQTSDDISDADLISERTHNEVHTVARNLMRKASAFFLDRGVPSLYLSFGLLNWKEADGSAMTSPLFLIPVELNTVGPRSTPRLSNSEDDAVVNPALKLRLAEFEIELPTAEELEGSSLGEVYGRLEALLRTQDVSKDWNIRDETHLAMFSFQKEAMYKDLLDNEALVQAHSAVQCLATSDPAQQSAEFQFDPIDPSDIDRQAPPETIPLVLDADSSQRAAIAAALQGRSFVMDGPPGTGKSQTIANMIGALLHAGKTVLFVSEKIAALDVVRNRLESVGLGSYLLELHSHKVARREVAQELLKTLDNVVVAPTAMSNISRSKARDHREKLNDYAQAMNEVRQPLNMSLHDVLGTYSRLSSEHSAPVPDADSSEFSESQLGEVQDALSRIARAWRPATERSTFLWKDVVDNQPLELRLQHALTALHELLGRRKPHFSVAEAYSMTALDDTPKLVSLLEHLQLMPDESVVQRWLIADGLDELREKRSLLAVALSDLNSAVAAVAKIVDVDWTALPSITSPMPEVQLPDSSPSPLDFDSLSSHDLNALAEQFSTQSRMLRQHGRSLQHHAQTVGWPQSESFTDVKMVHQLVNLRALNASPMPRWFSAAGIAAARATAAQLYSDISQLDHAEGVARNLYSANALHAPLGVLNDRFTNLHKGLRKLSGAYRMDKKTVIRLLNDASRVKEGIQQLSSAIEWSELVSRFENQHQERQSLLGHFYSGRQTDFQQLERALVVAERVLQVTGPAPSEAIVAYQVGYGDISAQHSAVTGIVADLDTWASGLRPEPELSGRPELQFGSFDEAVNWFEAHVEPAKDAATRITALEKATDKRPRNWLEAEKLIAARNSAADTLARIEDAAESFRNILGEYFNAADTDLNQLDSAVNWTFRMRELAGSRLTNEQLHVIVMSRASHGLGTAYTEWAAARDSVVTAFAESKHDELQTEFNDQSTAEELLRALIDDSEGQQEWFAYRQAYKDLAKFGLDVAVEYCSRHRLSPDEVSDVVMRALFRGWADAIIASDSRLSPQLSNERAALVEEYRQLDEQFVSAAISEIITAANSRRPANTSVGESAVIRREGAKQRRHRPVRDLIASTRSITPRIKPVFMMSPLAVSQYLPPEQLFDVVIFDEASQIPPGDAINCIYRAGSVILAGDDKQLPPTSFFERGVDETEDEDTDVKDFQSVLELAKASGAFNNLKLSWHYRSRHEDLIAFSNYKFYEGKLVTFPSAEQTGSNVGVEFFKVDGLYRRGGGADNPIEATKVAERIIEHYSSRPDLTLGVVTFSVAQSDSVQRALDEARVDRRDLDRFFNTEDRLDGFFIRALEQVQGDERDVIIFSVGYGPDEAGKVSTHFGALNRDKGWRRLNVGITRARQRVEVISSMHAGEIPPSTNENVEHLRNYLDYAERGQKVLAIPQSTTGLDPESPFEESVIVAIRSWGYTVEPQVGAAGYRIDLGVRHPQLPGSFAIGVECDGYQYHSAPSARDRDRLRDQILGGLGWRLHRIWGTSWYRDRTTEEQRLKTAIELAISQTSSCRTTVNGKAERPSVLTEQVLDFATPGWVQTYKAAPADYSTPDWIDAGEPDAANYMIGQIERIAEAEGPVHLDLVDDRIRYWWNIGRIGSKIRRNINLAIDAADVKVDGEFLVPSINHSVAVRSPTKIADRKIDHVHLQELAIAAKQLLVDAGDMSRDELSSAISQIFEWRRRGSNVEGRISEALNLLVKNGEASEHGGKLSALRYETTGEQSN